MHAAAWIPNILDERVVDNKKRAERRCREGSRSLKFFSKI